MKNVINEMKISFISSAKNESFARQVVASFASQLDPTMEEINDIKTVVSEAVTNCVVHAYKDKIGTIHIKSKIYDDSTIEIEIRDTGVGIENIEKALEPMYTTGDKERSGMGFTIMESFMDKLKVTSKINKGTKVTLTRKIKNRRR